MHDAAGRIVDRAHWLMGSNEATLNLRMTRHAHCVLKIGTVDVERGQGKRRMLGKR